MRDRGLTGNSNLRLRQFLSDYPEARLRNGRIGTLASSGADTIPIRCIPSVSIHVYQSDSLEASVAPLR
jgi:hypothetical protein